MINIIGTNEFINEIKEGVVVVDFFAKWCAPCKILAPIFEELAVEMDGKSKFIKVDVDASSDIASEYEISNIPAIVIFKDGEKQEMMIGFSPKEIIKEKIEEYL